MFFAGAGLSQTLNSEDGEFRLQGRISFSAAEFRLRGRIPPSGPNLVYAAEFRLQDQDRISSAGLSCKSIQEPRILLRDEFRRQCAPNRTSSSPELRLQN